MENDLLVMIYGAIMGVTGSIITSIVTAVFQSWMERREYDRRRSEELRSRLSQIHLPTDEEVRIFNSEHPGEQPPEAVRTSTAEAGAVLVSILLSSTAVYQTRDPILGFSFAAALGFLVARRLTRFVWHR